MQDHDTRLDALVLWSSHGHCADGALLLVVFDPAAHMLVHERPHFGWPSFDACASGFAFVQADDELSPLALGEVEDPGLPGVQRGDRGLARERFFRAGLCEMAGVVRGATYAALRCVRWRSLLEVR